MIKYATYYLYKNIITGDFKKVMVNDEEELEKISSSSEWIEITDLNEVENYEDLQDNS